MCLAWGKEGNVSVVKLIRTGMLPVIQEICNQLTDYLLKIVFLFVSCVCVYSCDGGSPFMYMKVRELLAGFSSLTEELGLSGLVPNDLPCRAI